MKQKIQIVILFSVLFGLSNCKKAENDILYNKKYVKEIKEARKELGQFLASNFIPGASVAVMKDGEIIYSEGLGWASRDLEVRANRKTKFRIGGSSELFTNIIYQKLVEEGKLNPDSSIQHYYPQFPQKEYKISLQNLAQKTSGLRDATLKERNWHAINITSEKGLDVFKDDPLATEPGLYQTESPYHYNVLGVVMEKVAAMNYYKLLEHYITDTLNLTNTSIDNPLTTIKDRSNFFDQNYIAQVVNAETYDLRYQAASNGILSNAEDLAKFGSALINSDYLAKETKDKLWEPTPLFNDIPSRMANGWMLFIDNSGRKIYGRTSSVIGGSSSIIIYPEENLIIAYACNLTGSMDKTPVFEVAMHFLPEAKEKAATNEE
ncbi:serine hydrolase domain-containing protein [uncultured Draconibacterium sp.]|uniref:serine hydrolase domain-containing protein n=1 Tax=uncultured Draconibacterium sp. TaxID=1573823 RepID=UPI0032171034